MRNMRIDSNQQKLKFVLARDRKVSWHKGTLTVSPKLIEFHYASHESEHYRFGKLILIGVRVLRQQTIP